MTRQYNDTDDCHDPYLRIREPKFIAYDNGWEDGSTGRRLGASPWCDSPIAVEAKAYYLGWKDGRRGVTWSYDTNAPVP